MKLLYEEFLVEVEIPSLPGMKTHLCGLCGNTGMVDTVGKVVSPAGVACGVRGFCICPNGRAMRKSDLKTKPKEPKVPRENGFGRYWLSWNETSKDYRPLKDPPNRGVIAWWCSGYAGDDSYSTMVALVEAKNEREAKTVIQKDWPGRRREWRFIESVNFDFRPGDRFPISKKWEKERIEGRRTK